MEYLEQPKVTYNGKYYLQAEFVTATGATQMFEYTTIKPIRNNLDQKLSPPTLAVQAVDLNRDDIPEQYNLTLTIKKPSQDL